MSIGEGPQSGSIAPTARVRDYTARFDKFLEQHVVPLEEDLARQNVGTPWQPHLDEKGRMHPAVWEARREVQRRAGPQSFYGPHISEKLGGGGFSRVEMHYVEEHVYRYSGLGLGLAALGWTEGPNPAIEHISDALRDQYLAPLMRGELSTAFANTEPNVGSDVLGMETNAKRDGTDWIINGRKAWITNSHFADFYQVTAITDAGAGTKSMSMFIVDAKTPGFQRGADQPTMLDDGLTGQLIFDNVRVPKENIVGEIGDGFALAMSWINWRRLCRGGMCSGWGSWLIDRATAYASERKSGGKPLAQLQAVQHLLARMDAEFYQARSTSLVAQEEVDQLGAFKIPLHRDVPRIISLIKLINDEAFFRLTDYAIQVHGAKGLTRGLPEEKLFRIARNLRIPAGASEIQLNAIARGRLRPSNAA